MPRYTVTFVKESGYRNYYQTIIEAEDQLSSVIKACKEAESKGIKLPDEVWTRIHQHKGT